MASWYDPLGVTDSLFGDPSKPYNEAGKEFEKYYNQAREYQQPYYEAGTGAIPQYQDYLKKMSDPAKYINNLTKQYSTSPQEQYAQDQAMRAATNAASSSGLIGSTPYQLQAQQNAGDIANQYQNQWLQNVLGINSQYGAGLGNLMGMGQGGANQITNLLSSLGSNMGQIAYRGGMAKQQQMQDLLGLLLRGGMFAL
jgi:hypothetical protein